MFVNLHQMLESYSSLFKGLNDESLEVARKYEPQSALKTINNQMLNDSAKNKLKYIITESLEIRQTKSNSGVKESTNGTKVQGFSFHKKGTDHTKFKMPLSHFNGHNFWILKAVNLNRGRGRNFPSLTLINISNPCISHN